MVVPQSPSMHDPVRVLCAASGGLEPRQTTVLPSLGDALVFHATRAAGAAAAVHFACAQAPWCARVLLVEASLSVTEVATLVQLLPARALACLGGFESDKQTMFEAIRRRGAPDHCGMIDYLRSRRLPRDLIWSVEDALALAEADLEPTTDASRKSVRPTQRTLNRHLSRYGPFRVSDWRRIQALLELTEVPSPVSFEQRCWERQHDPRTFRDWLAQYVGVEPRPALATPGWEWKVESALRRHGYVSWPGASRRGSQAHQRPVLAPV
jgi:hypothetical protein